MVLKLWLVCAKYKHKMKDSRMPMAHLNTPEFKYYFNKYILFMFIQSQQQNDTGDPTEAEFIISACQYVILFFEKTGEQP